MNNINWHSVRMVLGLLGVGIVAIVSALKNGGAVYSWLDAVGVVGLFFEHLREGNTGN